VIGSRPGSGLVWESGGVPWVRPKQCCAEEFLHGSILNMSLNGTVYGMEMARIITTVTIIARSIARWALICLGHAF